MTDRQRYFFGKEDKLKSRKQIDRLFSKGKQFSNFPFKVIWLPENEKGILQAGVGVSSRYFKKAVDRNRIKRLMREGYRLQKNELAEHLQQTGHRISVFILYTGRDIPEYSTVFERMGAIIRRLKKFSDESTEATA